MVLRHWLHGNTARIVESLLMNGNTHIPAITVITGGCYYHCWLRLTRYTPRHIGAAAGHDDTITAGLLNFGACHYRAALTVARMALETPHLAAR